MGILKIWKTIWCSIIHWWLVLILYRRAHGRMLLEHFPAHGRMLLRQCTSHCANDILPCAPSRANDILPCAQRYMLMKSKIGGYVILFSLAQYFKSCNGCYAWCPPCDARDIGYFCMMYVICANNFFVSKFISWKNPMEQIKFRKKKLAK